MQTKVLLVSPYSEKKVGGIGTWTKNILDYHSKQGQFKLIFLNTAFSFKSNLVRNKSQRIFQGIIDSILVLVLMLLKIIRFNPKTIHYTSSASYALVKDLFAIYIAKIFRIKFIIHWRFGRIPEIFELQNSEWKILKIVAKAANKSIVLDNQSLICFKNSGINNTVLIPNPVSEYLRMKAISINFDDKTFEIGTLVFVGHIIPDKGIYELVKACIKVEKMKQLILIGPVNINVKNELISIAAQHNNNWLVWKGEIPREEVFQYLYAANALCLPSYTEGFPNVVLEAMALGCPVIATRVGAIEEMLTSEDLGEAGLCVDPKNVEQLTLALEYIISNPEKAMALGKNGNQRVLLKYTLENVFDQYESLWQIN